MAVVYQQALGADELRALVGTWAELCTDISDAEFIAACMAHMRKSRFFPCPADILREFAERPVKVALPALLEEPEDKTPGMGMLVIAAFRGDLAAKDALEGIRRQYGRNMQ